VLDDTGPGLAELRFADEALPALPGPGDEEWLDCGPILIVHAEAAVIETHATVARSNFVTFDTHASKQSPRAGYGGGPDRPASH